MECLSWNPDHNKCVERGIYLVGGESYWWLCIFTEYRALHIAVELVGWIPCGRHCIGALFALGVDTTQSDLGDETCERAMSIGIWS